MLTTNRNRNGEGFRGGIEEARLWIDVSAPLGALLMGCMPRPCGISPRRPVGNRPGGCLAATIRSGDFVTCSPALVHLCDKGLWFVCLTLHVLWLRECACFLGYIHQTLHTPPDPIGNRGPPDVTRSPFNYVKQSALPPSTSTVQPQNWDTCAPRCMVLSIQSYSPILIFISISNYPPKTPK